MRCRRSASLALNAVLFLAVFVSFYLSDTVTVSVHARATQPSPRAADAAAARKDTSQTPPLYDATTLQRAAADFSTLSVAQRDGYGSIAGSDRRHSLPLITGDGFRHLADAYVEPGRSQSGSAALDVFGPDQPGWCASLGTSLELAGEEALVLFVSTMVGPEFFATRCLEDITVPFVLVTHNGDEPMPGAFAARLGLPRLVHWFAQNCDRAHPKLTCIPIGLENRRWGPPNERGHHGSMPELMLGFLAVLAPAQSAAAVAARVAAAATADGGDAGPPHTWAFFDRGTHAEVRDPLYASILSAAPPLSWINTAGPSGGLHKSIPHEMYRYMLTLAANVCPRGNGLDTHRSWETLLLGRTMIATRGPLDPLWAGLPVLLLEDWTELVAPGAEVRILNATRDYAARAPLAADMLFATHWLCLIGKAARREAEFCGTQALLGTLRGEGGAQRRAARTRVSEI